ncbi:hypothetical protein GCM10011609_76940 [Lentzea pudingi]|uniref:Uncharacterized protein n=1 Tax=Lentzea pudingi TaxID=1789439 RepID=A0ABQ2IS24_9PSEU|nr:hypothetical protein [Lentzea pudingi]GGN23841.1 hypothetical protein GCM10011609_76940 [Lentzea pudingi]
MTNRIIDHDQDAGATSQRYHYTRVTEIHGHTVRARIQRGIYNNVNSGAVAEIRANGMSWSTLTAAGIDSWWYDTPKPSPDIDPAAVLGPLAEQLLCGAAEILASPPAMPTLSVHLYRAINGLLAISGGFTDEARIDPDDIAWAYAHGGALHIIEHPDGSVTFTKAHRDDCPFLTSAGARDCDDECDFPHPADTTHRSTS